jgi:hypothetical protein
LRVPTAQIDAWAAAHRGSIDKTCLAVDQLLADAALARMMLHRRRAVLSQVLEGFFARAGTAFAPRSKDAAPKAPRRFGDEMAAAKAAGGVAEDALGSTPPLLFERAMLADMEGRQAEALADLKGLLDRYPGFVVAAMAAARLSLANKDPLNAIEKLAYVERELVQTREGAALLADVLRAVEMPEAASSYDLAALTNAGYADSRGNDCAPVDTAGRVVSHNRMLPAFYIGTLPDGRILYNDRGVYYVAGSAISALLSVLFNTIKIPKAKARRGDQSTAFALRRACGLQWKRLKPLLYKRNANAEALRTLVSAIVSASRQLARWRDAGDRALRRGLPSLEAWGLLKVPECDRHSRIGQERLRSSIDLIFGLPLAKVGQETHVSVGSTQLAALSGEAKLWQLARSGALPPLAEQALRRLASEAGMHDDDHPHP